MVLACGSKRSDLITSYGWECSVFATCIELRLETEAVSNSRLDGLYLASGVYIHVV